MKLKLAAVLVAVGLVGAGCNGTANPEPVLPGVQSLLFVKRAFIADDGSHVVSGGNRQTIDYQRYVPGGGLFVLSPATPSGELRNLTAEFAGVDVNGIDLSFDATQVVFSMRRDGDEYFHLYIANVTGAPEIRQLTFGPYNDIKPLFVPGGRIAFATLQPYTAMGTRNDEYERAASPQIATVSLALGDADRRVCGQNLSHAADPFLMSDGRIGFARWEHLGPVNDVKLMAMNPDCTQMVALAGQHGKPGNSLVQAREVRPGVFVGITTSRNRTIQAGSLVQIDSRSRSGASGIALDEQTANITVLTPGVPTGSESPPSGVGRYRTPMSLPGSDRMLVSWSDGDVNDRNELAGTAPNFGIYLFDPATREKTLVYDDPSFWDLYATPIAPREIPAVHPGTVAAAPDPTTPAVIGSVDVTVTSLDESVSGGQFSGTPLREALRGATHVRVIEGFSGEIGGVRRFGLTTHEGAAIMGEATVRADGSWEAQLPPYLPYHLQPVDRFGLAIRNQMLWIQAMPGESRRCGGCHESRSSTIVPRMGPTTLAQQAGPENFVIPIPARRELPWIGGPAGHNVQDVFNAKCVSCHSGGAGDPFAGRFYTVSVTPEGATMPLTYQIPYLNLSDAPIETYYERMVVTYPMSYVSLLMPGAMTQGVTAMGDMPPEWVQVGDARGSRLIEQINAQAEDDPTAFAYAEAPHPEDVGVTLTREERLTLIQMVDLGGQYYSRQNVAGARDWSTVMY